MKIEKLFIFTKNLQEQKRFYTENLNLPITDVRSNSFTIKVGYSELCFNESQHSSPYHFAINIPSFQIEDAYNWLIHRVNILQCENESIFHNEDWNSESIYFYDLDNNILEFIARKNMKIINTNFFKEDSIIGISEIGVPSENIERIYGELSSNFECPIYDGSFERFCAVGDENGLFVLIDKNKKKWLPNFDEAFPSDFAATVQINTKDFLIKYSNSRIVCNLIPN